MCVLHPPTIAGRPFRAITAEGLLEGSLPAGIGPQPLIEGEYLPLTPAFSSLTVDFGQAVRAQFEFEGDKFEIEDQRNWLDASYKSYSTAMVSGVSHARPGQEFFQQVRVKVTGPGGRQHLRTAQKLPPRLELDRAGRRGTMPAIGLGMASGNEPLSTEEANLLRGLGLDHLRVDVHLGRPSAGDDLSRAALAACDCGSGVEMALFVDSDARRELELAKKLANGLDVPIRRFLVFGESSLVTPSELLEVAREALGRLAPIFGGTNIYFAELNRDRPDPAPADGFTFSANPQVHAPDDRSLMEAPPTLADMLRLARDFLGDRPLAVSPITLLPRFNPDAPGGRTPEPPPADHRQASLLCATWTLECAAYLALERAQSVTFFETSGDGGVVGRPTHPTHLGELVAGSRFPVYDVLARLCQWAGMPTYEVRSTDPLAAFGVACRVGDVLQLCVANATEAELSLELGGLPETGCSIDVLDYEAVAFGWETGTAFASGPKQVSDRAPRELSLSPCAIAFVSFGGS